ncbi:Flagellar assembly protein FliH [Shewanella piezotolerans WP3]|uniref:Flagellar assembly protein FliH n=1 Tax=Shewanella piezotolerans (strain WP3 / JCM 13877) TaxID=225849 RepID=B8CVN3_SHEPW|nr:flagellar assembly protein FliH [Shewanella piezotolerans]ACJ31709.1 Flagellar assembly protein FliH [Shewanella piezotolerans WP3]
MTSASRKPLPHWRLTGDHARKHRFSPLVTIETNQEQAEGNWQDFQQAFDKGYDEGVQKGHQAGFESGAEEGRKAGHAAGFHQGRIEGQQKGKDSIDADLNSIIAPLGALKALLEEGHAEQVSQQQSLILELVKRVSLQVIRCELTLQPQQILGLVEETLAALPDDPSQVKIHLEPSAVDKLRELAADKIQDWSLVADASISAGGCRIVSATSDADASVETRLNSCMAQVENHLQQSTTQNVTITPEAQVETA